MIGKKRNSNTKTKTETSFLIKLYTILKNNRYSDYIQWSKDGLSIIIFNQNEFTKKVLPHFFKHHNFSSFVRQLNMYNFHKIKTIKKNEQKYMHDEFHKWTPLEDIQLIKKKLKHDEDIIIPKKRKNLLNNKNEDYNIDNYNSIEEKKEFFERFEKLDEETKNKNYEYILKNGNLSNNLNNIILYDLLNKSKEKIEKQKNIQNEVNNLIAQNQYLMEQLKISNNQLIMQKDISQKSKGMLIYIMKKMYNIKNNTINIGKKINVNVNDKNTKLINLINKYRIYKNTIELIKNTENYTLMTKNSGRFKSPMIQRNDNFEINQDIFLEINNQQPTLNDNDYSINAEKSIIQNSIRFPNLRNSRFSNRNKLFTSYNSNISNLKYY